MCLPVSRLFWVSSLAYPNLLGTKCYVVVVVVVVVCIFIKFHELDVDQTQRTKKRLIYNIHGMFL
jgi:hypothetical protein